LAETDPEIQSGYQSLFKSKLDNAVKLRYSLNIEEPIGFARLMQGGTKAVVVTNKGSNWAKQENHVYIVDLVTGDKQAVYSVDGPIDGATMNDQGTIFSFLERKIRTYHAAELSTGKVLCKRQSAFPFARWPMFTGDGNHLIVGGSMEGRGAKITVVDLSDGKEVASREFTGFLFNYHPLGESGMGFLVNQGARFSGVNKFISTIWDWKTQSENVLFDGQGEVGAINWSKRDERRGNIIANSVDYFQSPKQVTYIQVLSQQDNKPIYATTKKGGWINRYGLSPNSKYLALARNDGGIEVHDMNRLAKVWESQQSQLGAGGVRSLEFSPDGLLLLGAGGGRNLGLWEVSTGRLVTSSLHHKGLLAMVNWNEQGNAFLTTSNQGEIRLYEMPNLYGAEYLNDVAMTPKTTRAIAESLSTRLIDEGRIVSFTSSETNTPPSLASLPAIHQYADSEKKRQWHLSQARIAKNGNQWSAVKFHLDQASALAPLNSLEIQNRLKSHLNLGQYELALADLTLFQEVAEKGEETTVSYMPAIATGWKEEVWYYSGYSSCSNPLSGFNQEYLSQQSLVLNNGKRWTELREFSPTIGQNGINMNNITEDDIFVDAPENSVYYISKKFEINESGFHQIVFDSDDAMMVWINGELIHKYFSNNGRGLQFPGRDLVSAWLQKGINIITIKIVNGTGPTGFSFVVGDQQDGILTTKRNYALLALGRKNEIKLKLNEQPENPGVLFNQAQEFALFNPKKEAWDQADQKLRSDPMFKSILEGSFIRPASYVKPGTLPTQDQLKDGFTVEFFVNTQQKFGVHHIVSNGGSFLESGFSLLVGGVNGGVLRGEFQNMETNEKILMDVSYPYDRNWHHVAMIYDAIKKHAMIYFDGKPATVPTAYKSPLIFNPKYLRIGENEMRRMGFNGAITDVRIWPKVLSSETIEKHANGETGGEPGKPLINLPLRFTNAEQAQEASGSNGFTAENINWRQGDQSHPMAGEEDWVYAQFRNQGFGKWQEFTIAGILEYRRGNYQHAMELLFRAFNGGRYLSEVKLRAGTGNRIAQLFIAMAFQKSGRQADYERFREAINVDLNKFEMRTWENPREIDVMKRIMLKTFQREMNALAEE
jgi:WD40 repeat protein